MILALLKLLHHGCVVVLLFFVVVCFHYYAEFNFCDALTPLSLQMFWYQPEFYFVLTLLVKEASALNVLNKSKLQGLKQQMSAEWTGNYNRVLFASYK